MEILLLTGACGVGKSSTAKAWAKLKDGAIVECDYFTEWIFKKDFPKWTIEDEIFVAKLAGITAIEYVKMGMPVAIENVWSPKGVELLVQRFKNSDLIDSIKVVWLFCESEENHRRDELRVPEDQMKERLDVVNDELHGYTWQDYVVKIDTTMLSLEESLARVEQLASIPI